ncbi:UNVERIFIED_CONTAM: hypothetical protein Scaly_1406100 [Sesamum calycinum]|uniref:Uncharacterized protein n=1 Tax=Sesamum calycinum TaxID=2727403 RepID=A0AAW2PQL3_9LAMI
MRMVYIIRHHIGSGRSISNETQKEMSKQNEDGSAAGDQQRSKELLDKNQRAKMLENLRYLENPMLLELYGTLFADNSSRIGHCTRAVAWAIVGLHLMRSAFKSL